MSTRDQLLEDINELLESKELQVIRALGMSQEGEIEITGMPDILDENPYFVLVRFPVLLPHGEESFHRMIFYRNSTEGFGVVAVCIMNGSLIAIAKEWRLACSNWCYNFPRAFYTPYHEDTVREKVGTLQLDSPLVGLLDREFGTDFLAQAKVKASPLGEAYTDNGICAHAAHHYAVEMNIPEKAINDRSRKMINGVKMKFWTHDEMLSKIRQGVIFDQHSLSTLSLLQYQKPVLYNRLMS